MHSWFIHCTKFPFVSHHASIKVFSSYWNVSVQVKRIHEYKRQLMNIMGIVYRYKKMKEMSASGRKSKFVPRVCMFGGKAFSTYVQAKRIVKFIADVGATINHDPSIGDLLKVWRSLMLIGFLH